MFRTLNTAAHLFWTVPNSSLLPFKYYHIKVQSCKGWVKEARVPLGKLTPSVSQMATPDVWHDKQIPTERKWIQFHVCTTQNKEIKTRFKCSQCNMQFCVHVSRQNIKFHFWRPSKTKLQIPEHTLSKTSPLLLLNPYLLNKYHDTTPWQNELHEKVAVINRGIFEVSLVISVH